ncbi:MAG: hypothetical protein K6C36_04530 [Clostridia bacterium]|nr:hypothetical protein [Clostridia bacterium]
MKTELKNRLFLPAALLFLFATQAIFLYKEIKLESKEMIVYGAGAVFFLAMYVICLTVPSFGIRLAVSLAGPAGLAALYGGLFGYDITRLSVFFPLLSASLFVVLAGVPPKIGQNRRSFALNAVVTAYFAVLIAVAVVNRIDASRIVTYGRFLFLALAVLFIVIRRSKSSGKSPYASARRDSKTVYLFAMITLVQSGVLFLFFDNEDHTEFYVPLFWIAGLVVLYEKREPLVCDFVASFIKKRDKFLYD